MVDIYKFWVRALLEEYDPRFLARWGLDLNGNGRIEGTEVFGDLDQNGEIGDSDYCRYLESNRDRLSELIPFFRWGREFHPENRIHQLIYLESDLFPSVMVESAYQFLADFNHATERRLRNWMSPERQVEVVYDALQYDMGVNLENQEDSSFVSNIARRAMDCDTSSFAVMAVGDERDWPLVAVLAPQHLFLRWEAGETVFNMDHGESFSNQYYQRRFDIPDAMIAGGAYLSSLENNQLRGEFLAIRAFILQSRDGDANDVWTAAANFNPNSEWASSLLGNVLLNAGEYLDALSFYDQGLRLNPEDANLHNGRGAILFDLGRYEEALVEFEMALQINADDAAVQRNRGLVLDCMGRYGEALTALDKSLAIREDFVAAHWERAIALYHMGRYPEALTAYDRARSLNSDFSNPLFELDSELMAFWDRLKESNVGNLSDYPQF